MCRFRSAAAFTFAALLVLVSRPASAVWITEFTFGDAQPESLVASPDGRIWWSEYAMGKIGYFRPYGDQAPTFSHWSETAQPAWIAMDWTFSFYPVWSDASLHQVCSQSQCYTGLGSNAEPRGMTRTPGGLLWVVEHYPGRLAVKEPGTTAFHEVATTPLFETTDGLSDIAYGVDGNLWVTEQDSSRIARVSLLGMSLTVTHFNPPTPSSHPLHIVSGPDGKFWFTERGANKIGRIDPQNTAAGITEFTVPTAASSPTDITVGPDGALWFTELLSGKIGRITTAGTITEHALPSGSGCAPTSIVLGLDGDLWVAENGSHKVARVRPRWSGDVNDDGKRDVIDVFYLINYLFAGGPAPK
jgi:virginiamycin B lyase